MKRALIIAALIISVAASVWAHWPRSSLPRDMRADRVVVDKSDRIVELYLGDQLLRSYTVALGRKPLGDKQQEGDGRTPEGHYVLDYRKSDSSFHRALHISYPSPIDTAAAQAQEVNPGGVIMLHGIRNGLGFLGRLHALMDWTDGCIAVTNPEIEEIWRVVPDGTPIIIEP